ncbi:hypothetical protein AAGU50_11740 [Aeromonas dhakensis]
MENIYIFRGYSFAKDQFVPIAKRIVVWSAIGNITDLILTVTQVEDVGIAFQSANQCVIPYASFEVVQPCTTIKHIIPLSPTQSVIPLISMQGVITTTTNQQVSPLATLQFSLVLESCLMNG